MFQFARKTLRTRPWARVGVTCALAWGLPWLMACQTFSWSPATETSPLPSPGGLSCQDKARVLASFHERAWRSSGKARETQIAFMRGGVVDFYRATPVLFHKELLGRAAAWNDALAQASTRLGEGWVFGDPHPGNLACDAAGADFVPRIDDFDDVAQGPRIHDVIRAYLGILVMFPAADREALAQAVATSYAEGSRGDDGGADFARLFAKEDVTPARLKVPRDDADVARAAKDRARELMDGRVATGQGAIARCADPRYVTLRGGSSLGLPRFRAVCGQDVVEIKATRPAALAYARNPLATGDDDARVIAGVTALAPDHAADRRFVALGNAFADDKDLGAYRFYGHKRPAWNLSLARLTVKDAPAFGRVLAKAIATGHRRTGLAPLDAAAAANLAVGMREAAKEWLLLAQSDAAEVPACVEALPRPTGVTSH